MVKPISIVPRDNRRGAAAQPSRAIGKTADRSAVGSVQPSRTHRYHVGERLVLSGRHGPVGLGGFCAVVSTLPIERSGAVQYRVRLEQENFERVVAEADLRRPSELIA